MLGGVSQKTVVSPRNALSNALLECDVYLAVAQMERFPQPYLFGAFDQKGFVKVCARRRVGDDKV